MSSKLDIVFYVNGMEFNGDALKTQSLGGSETMGLHMAKELANRGHNVTMFSNCTKPGKYDDVTYRHISEYERYMTFSSVDVNIVQRVPQILNLVTKSKINILWQHDLGLKRNRNDIKQPLWNIDTIFGLTDYHINQMSETYSIPKSGFTKTRNGIEPVKIDKSIKREKKRLIYTARPERGLDVLLKDIMPKLWEQDPDIQLRIAGYDNTVEQMKPFYESCNQLIKGFQEKGYNIKHLGALNKKNLYKEYQKATLYVYPTAFEEISCITAMECMANGLPLVGTNLGALPETLNNKCAVLIEGNNKSQEYQDKFIKATLKLISEPIWQEKMRVNAIERAKEFHLSKLAEEWESLFYEFFKKKTSNKEALANHFYRTEDIMALKYLVDKESNINPHPSLQVNRWQSVLKNEYAIIGNPHAYDNLYEQYGKNFRSKFESGEIQMNIQPYARVLASMDNMKNPKHILDYGCAVGNEAIQFVNRFGCKVTSVNISEDEMEVGRQLAEKHCKHPENITWIKANTPDDIKGTFDTIFAGEIIEHVAEPQKLIDQLEAKCQDGGQMFFTVPFGPWGDTYSTLEQRGHLWSFDMHDLKVLFKDKKNFLAGLVPGSVNEKNRETLGWYFATYTKTNKPTGIIDLERKINIQAPRETLSACLIVGGKQEGHLHKCIQSIEHVADEIIVSDCGMSPLSKQVLSNYDKVKIVKGLNPLEHGFDAARNESIKHAKGDWILWLDSDEELVTPEKILKYLRNNLFNGYAIRQHHFSAQPVEAFKFDMPIRLFRNHKDIKFFGVVHEHPETEVNKGVGESTIIGDADISHTGYLSEEGRRKRFDRNYGLLLRDVQKNPDRVLTKFLIMRDWMHIVRYTLEKTNQLTPEVVDLCNKVIEQYRKEFLGKHHHMCTEGLKYYSEALSVLNRGLEYCFSLDIKPQNTKVGNDTRARFDTEEDFKKFMNWQIKNQTEIFEGKYI